MEYLKITTEIEKVDKPKSKGNNNYYTYSYNKWKQKQYKEANKGFKRGGVSNRRKKKRKARKARKPKNRVPRQYKVYIKSKFWENRKNKYWQTYTKQCCVCGSYERVALHHARYAVNMYGKEPDSWLFPLCQTHHQEFHELNPLKSNMEKATLKYIEDNYIPHDSHNC